MRIESDFDEKIALIQQLCIAFVILTVVTEADTSAGFPPHTLLLSSTFFTSRGLISQVRLVSW